MQGQYLDIGGRRTYFPPFANERFDGPPYWACTFTSLLNGANVAWLGQKPATANEIRALARASGDVDLKGGSRSSHMISALRVRYGRKMVIERLTPEQVKHRLANGWAMVAALTYGALPEANRRWSPRFKGGHRVVLIGWDDGRTRLLDPMANRDASHAGQWIQWSDFEPAWWSSEQLWFKEGSALPKPEIRTIRSFAPARRWIVRGGTTVSGRSATDPRLIAKRLLVRDDGEALFDRFVEVRPMIPGAEPIGHFIHVATGVFAGLLVDPRATGITASIGEGQPQAGAAGTGAPGTGAPASVAAAAGSAAASGVVAPGVVATAALDAARLDAARKEWDRIHDTFTTSGALPDRP